MWKGELVHARIACVPKPETARDMHGALENNAARDCKSLAVMFVGIPVLNGPGRVG